MSQQQAEAGALDGIRVLDFSHALAGPYTTMLLATYGATVYKVEARDGGDMGRGWGPPFAGSDSWFFLGMNRDKRGISIDLKQPDGIELCLRLMAEADVVLENFRPGTMDRLGLGYEAARARNPRLVYCSISGYGQQGPSRDDAAMDLIVQCSSGLMSITGTEAGEEVRCGYGVSDITAGMFAVIGILLALRERDRSGVGQRVDVAMLDSMISAMSSNYMSFLGSGVLPRPMGTAFGTVVPYRVFHAADRAVGVAVGSERLWAAFCGAIDQPDLIKHPSYATNAERIRNREVLETLLSDVFLRRSAAEWVERLRSAGVPCSLVRNYAEVVRDDQTKVREMFPLVERTTGTHPVSGAPVKLSRTPGRASSGAPLLGEHTRQTLVDLLGLRADEIDRLASQGVVYEGDA